MSSFRQVSPGRILLFFLMLRLVAVMVVGGLSLNSTSSFSLLSASKRNGATLVAYSLAVVQQKATKWAAMNETQ